MNKIEYIMKKNLINLLKERLSTQEIIQILYDEAIKLGAKKIIDLGVYGGGSTRAFLLACLKTDGHVWSVDIENSSRWFRSTRKKIEDWNLLSLWTFTLMDDLEYVKTWTAGFVDIVMIDTSHTYDQTLAELNAYSKLVRIGGLIFLHDTKPGSFRGVVYGVKEAIEKFLENEGDKWKYFEYNTRFGLGRLTRVK